MGAIDEPATPLGPHPTSFKSNSMSLKLDMLSPLLRALAPVDEVCSGKTAVDSCCRAHIVAYNPPAATNSLNSAHTRKAAQSTPGE
jgi:hypothetical protein